MEKRKKTICLSEMMDLELRIQAAKRRKTASQLIEEALNQFFKETLFLAKSEESEQEEAA